MSSLATPQPVLDADTTTALLDPFLSRFVAALPDFILSAVFLIAWISPETIGNWIVFDLMLAAFMEFFVIHSMLCMGQYGFIQTSLLRKVVEVIMLTAIYLAVAYAIGQIVDDTWTVPTMMILLANRVFFIFQIEAPTDEKHRLARREWGAVFSLYGICTALTVSEFISLPYFSLTPAFLETLDLGHLLLLSPEPHRVMAFGVLYFTTVGLSQLFDHRWLPLWLEDKFLTVD